MRHARPLLVLLFIACHGAPCANEPTPTPFPLALAPCRSVWAGALVEYENGLRTLLENESAYRERPVARAIVRPSHKPEWSVSVHPSAPGYEVIAVTLDRSYWETRKEAHAERTGSEITGRAVHRVRVSEETGRLLARVWTTLLREVGNDDPQRLGLDGTTTTFLSLGPDDGNFLCAETWSPDGQSAAARLSTLSEGLLALARADDATRTQAEASVVEHARALLLVVDGREQE